MPNHIRSHLHTSPYMHHIFILFSFIICASPSRTCGRTSFNHMRTPSLHLLHRAHSTPCTFDTDHIEIHSLHLQPQDAFYRIHWWSTPPFTTFSSPATFKYIPHTYILHIWSRPTFAHIRHIRSRHIRTAFSSFFPAATFCQPLAQLAHTHMCIATALTRRQTTHPSPTRMPAS